MFRSRSPRLVLGSLLLLAVTACGRREEGQCEATLANGSATWPLAADSSSYEETTSPRYGRLERRLRVSYRVDDTRSMGSHFELGAGATPVFEVPHEVQVTFDPLAPQTFVEDPWLLSWEGMTASGSGWSNPPGRPRTGTFTLTQLSERGVAGQFTLHLDELQKVVCSFDVAAR
jgi:hypothetical protein